MARSRWIIALCLTFSLAEAATGGDDAAAGGDDAAAEPTAAVEQGAGEELFIRRIWPLLQEKCLACHGQTPDEVEGGLDLTTAETAAVGGDSGVAAIRPGKPGDSPLYLAATREHAEWSAMPPKEANRLTADEIRNLSRWIEAGATWPDAARIAEVTRLRADAWAAEDGREVATSAGLSPQWNRRKYQPAALWAYQPITKPQVSSVGSAAIDELLDARRPEGLDPAPPADRLTLLRRVSFDLTGLPPTPEEHADFLADPAPDPQAFARVIERLLASPHYGERMAQHWLDVVRYADSSGLANDYERGNAWRYRDYVVRAFNEDKPYDRFVLEQIAGDELDVSDPENLVATGFLRMGPWELTGMEVAKVARQRFLDDVTNGVGEAFLGQALQCARCHDHKFDPIPTRDYYAIQAVFATTQLSERDAPFLPSENVTGFEEERYLLQRQQDHQRTLRELDERLLENAQRWFQEAGGDPAVWDAAVAEVRARQAATGGPGNVFNQTRAALLKRGVPESEYPPKLVGFTPEQFGGERVARKGLERIRWELDRYQPFALAVYSGRTPQLTSVSAPQRVPKDLEQAGELESTCILIGGDPFAVGETVRPGPLSVLDDQLTADIPDTVAGRRLALARWIIDPRHPLTSRVIVNRVWLWHFGQAIAGNPNNFGSTGKRPTHPELLDWLAATFIEEGWSFKALHRKILNSAAYRRGAEHPHHDRLSELDPLGSGYAVFRPRRLTAEELRDAMLVATGELNRGLGGIPNRPEIHLEAALQPRQVMGTFAAAWTPNPLPSQRHRRSLYSLKLRGLVDPMREVFNAPAADFSCEMRETSTITPQVFTLFNGRGVHTRALALAARAIRASDSDEAAVGQCFGILFGRPPESDELQACLEHWRRMREAPPGSTDEPSVAEFAPREVIREAVEENTGEKFRFVERLYANDDFVPDLRPADVDARTRGLAEVCLALFNTHEFAYVY